MATTVSTQVNPVATKLVVDSDVDSTASNNTTGASGTLYMVEIDNSADSATIVYFKMVDAATATAGTTNPTTGVSARYLTS